MEYEAEKNTEETGRKRLLSLNRWKKEHSSSEVAIT